MSLILRRLLSIKAALNAMITLSISFALTVDFAHACLGGHAAFGNAILQAGRVTVNDTDVPFPVVDAGNANKVLPEPIQLVGSKTLKVHVLYIETTAKYEIASVIYKVEQDGHSPTIVRVKSNVSASGMRTRSIAPQPADIAREPMPKVDDVFGCGGSEGRSSGGGAIGR
jgi:hypothetical protein